MIRKLQFPDIRVLLVESEAQMLPLYQFALEDLGFAQIICATNTEEALDQIYFNSPGLVVLGEALFPKSAPEFLADIRQGKTGSAADVPLLMVCTDKARAAIKKSRWSEAVEFARAPASMQSLRRHVCAALKQRRDEAKKPVCAPQASRSGMRGG